MEEKLLVSDIISIELIKDTVENILHNYDDISCYLFGSYAKGTPTPTSDIDLLLIVDKEKYSYDLICQIKSKIKNSFEQIIKYCNPIYGYCDRINSDSYILFRQYINYGILLHGLKMDAFMNKESMSELKQLEFTKYWTPMYKKKIIDIEYYINQNININTNSIIWQYLYLVLYWYAKAQLTLSDKQNSLNNFTLEYIYVKLLQINLNHDELNYLQIIQNHRDVYINYSDIELEYCSFTDNFKFIQRIISSNHN